MWIQGIAAGNTISGSALSAGSGVADDQRPEPLCAARVTGADTEGDEGQSATAPSVAALTVGPFFVCGGGKLRDLFPAATKTERS